MHISHFINFSINGKLCCFCLLALANNAAMNKDVQISVFLLLILLGEYWEMEMLECMVHLFFFFLNYYHAAFHIGSPFYVHTSNIQDSFQNF